MAANNENAVDAMKSVESKSRLRSPQREVDRLLKELDQQLRVVFSPETFGGRGASLFYDLLVDEIDIDGAIEHITKSLYSNPELMGRGYYLVEVLSACSRCVVATRLNPAMAWPAVLDAQRHAGAALAMYVAGLEQRHASKVAAHYAKGLQTAANDQIRAFLFDCASVSKLATVSAAATHIANWFHPDTGTKKLSDFGATLKLDRLAITFQEFIHDDMVRLGVRAKDVKVSQSENRVKFAEWKKLYVSHANVSTPSEIC